MTRKSRRYLSNRIKDNFKNCTVNVAGFRYEPFITNETSGFEIEIVKEIGGILNINFNISVYSSGTDWGKKDESGIWSGLIGEIYNNSLIGLGNVFNDEEAEEFEFTFSYFTARINWVVPIAQIVPKWRIFIAIFTVKLWGVCAGVVVFSTLLFNKISKHDNNSSLQDGYLSTLQILLTQSVPRQPKFPLLRIFFLSLAVFSIIITSVYTCSLVYYMTNTIREHQMSTPEDIVAANLSISPKYMNLYNNSQDELGKIIFKKQKMAEKLNLTSRQYFTKIGDTRKYCALARGFVVKYFLSVKKNLTNDENGNPKVFLIDKPVLSYPIVMIMRKGLPYLNGINNVIQLLVQTGIANRMAEKYSESLKKFRYLEAHSKSAVQALALDHLQGAFVLLLIGATISVVGLFLEISYTRVFRNKNLQVQHKKIACNVETNRAMERQEINPFLKRDIRKRNINKFKLF